MEQEKHLLLIGLTEVDEFREIWVQVIDGLSEEVPQILKQSNLDQIFCSVIQEVVSDSISKGREKVFWFQVRFDH